MAKVFKYVLDFSSNAKKFGDDVGGVEGALRGAAVAAGALFAADKIMDAASAVADYAIEISNTKIAVETLAQVHGAAANKMAGEVTALANSYDQDVNETIGATNVLMRSFGEDSKKAFDLFNLGFAGAANANGDLLKQVSEYSPHFAEAGLSAQQMFSVIAEGNKQGVFDDKAADAIKEASIRLREMTTSTQDALNGIGLSSAVIQQSIADGSMSMFDAMQMVSAKLKDLPAQAPEVGAALADIFGGPGEDGINFIRTLADVDESMQTLVADSVSAQVKWTAELAKFHTVSAATFGGVSEGITEIKTALLQAANFLIDNFDTIKTVALSAGAAFVTYKGIMLGSTLATNGMTLATKAAALAQRALNVVLKANPIGLVVTAIFSAIAAFKILYDKNEEFRIRVDFAAKWAAAALTKAWVAIKMGAEQMWLGIKTYFTAIPKAASAIWKTVKRALKGENIKDALAEEFGKIIGDVSTQAQSIREKYSEELAGVEMPSFAEFYQSEKSKGEAALQGEQDGESYANGLAKSASGSVGAPRMGKLETMEALPPIKLEVEGADEAQEKLLSLESIMAGVANRSTELQDRLKAQMEQTREVANAVADAASGAFDIMAGNMLSSMGEAETGTERFAQGMVATLLKLVSMALSQSIANAIVGATASGAATGPGAVVATPAFIATAVGGVLAAFASIPKFAKGGLVSGSTMGVMGEYPNASINPEVIAPLDKLKGMMGGNQNLQLEPVVLETILRGEDIYLQQQKTARRFNKRG